MVLAGQLEEVARYCESDVLNTYRVWLVYELFRGAITAKELDWSETQVKDFVASRKATNPHLCVAVGIGKQLAAVLRIKALRRLRCCASAVCRYGEGDRWVRRDDQVTSGKCLLLTQSGCSLLTKLLSALNSPPACTTWM